MVEKFFVMDDEELPFTLEQYAAAQFFVARLAAEANEREFAVTDLGWEWTPFDGMPIVMTDDDLVLRATDFIRAALVLLWSVVNDMARSGDQAPEELIQTMGVLVAAARP